MELINTKISGPQIVKTTIYKDKRGFLKEVYKQKLIKKRCEKMKSKGRS